MSQKKKTAPSRTGAAPRKKGQQAPAGSGKDTPAATPPAPATEPFDRPDAVPPGPDRNGKAAKQKKRSKPAPQPKLSALEAAAKLLQEVAQPLSCPEMIAAMAEKGYWSSPKGRTPAATLYAAISKEIKTKGKSSRFRKTERGRFARTPSA